LIEAWIFCVCFYRFNVLCFRISLDHFNPVLLVFVVTDGFSFSSTKSPPRQEIADNNVSEMTYPACRVGRKTLIR